MEKLTGWFLGTAWYLGVKALDRGWIKRTPERIRALEEENWARLTEGKMPLGW